MSAPESQARAEATLEGGLLVVRVGGNWRITAALPRWSGLVPVETPRSVRVESAGLGAWDSSLALFLRDRKSVV